MIGLLIKYNLYFQILHIDFMEASELIINFIETYYEERVHKQWLNSLIMNDKPISYKEYLKSLGHSLGDNGATTTLTTEEIRTKNKEILNSFKDEWEVI